MSVLNQSGEEQVECPLCMEPLEVDDLHFYPCTCGYQICRFCWNRIREGENGLCPACRKAYPENPADFTPLSQEQVAAIKTEKKAREQKRRNKTMESRRALANVRVVQNNLVFVVGLPVRLADPEILKRQEYFGKYGKIHKVVINQSTAYAGTQGPSASAYVTYVSPADALRAIQGVNNVTLDGRVLKGSLGTTKYCANFMKNQPCPKPDCMYLHELGDPKASFTKEEMHAGLHQVYERKLHNQLSQAQRDKPDDKQCNNSSGNSSTSAEKGSSKDGNQSNVTPTLVVTSSNINIVNSSNSSGSSASGSDKGSGNGTNGIGNGSGKEAWPSLGSSPPSDSPARKQPSPKPQQSTVKSQENGTSESSSPTLTQQQAQTKQNNKEHTENKTNRSNKDNSTNGPTKKSKSEKKQKSSNNSINEIETETEPQPKPAENSTQEQSVFENENHTSYLSNELNELESDRHSLLENHDLLDNSDHGLLEDDDSHNLLNDSNNDVIMMLRHKEMFAGLVDSNNLPPHMKSPILNGYGILDRDTVSYLGNDRQINQISQKITLPKDMRREELNRNEMLMRQNELLARQRSAIEHKHYLPASSIGLESSSEMLGANYHPNPNMLPPFGMRVDNSLGTSSLGNTLSTTMSASSLANIGNIAAGVPNSMGLAANSIGGGFMLHNQQLLQNQQLQSGLVNGFDGPQTANEGRYLAENMDKFFTDFHKAQQRRLLLSRSEECYVEPQPHQQHQPSPLSQPQPLYHNMLSAERLEMEHKQRMNNMRVGEGMGVSMGTGSRAAGDGDDDLDFDPFKETQKALAELMENEMMQNTVSSGDSMDRVRRAGGPGAAAARMAPPGFGPVNSFGQPPRHQQHQGYNSNSAMFSDWTQMDPAIMSTSVNFGKNLQQPQQSLNAQQQELFAKFNQLGVQPNGVNKLPVPLLQHQWHSVGSQKLPLQWGGVAYNNIPLPPGFAPAKPPQHPAECIDAK